MIQKGTIVFMRTNIGSKSEGILPFLYIGKGKFLEVWKSEDDSMRGDMLAPYDGQQITAHGEINDYDVFIIETIETGEPVQTPFHAVTTETTEIITPTETIEDTDPVDSENNNTATEE